MATLKNLKRGEKETNSLGFLKSRPWLFYTLLY
jgi:hypothetical protein